jgi:hypothetical protein
MVLGVGDHPGPLWVEIVVEHDFEVIRLRLDAGRFEPIHDYLSFSAPVFVVDPGKERVHGSKEVGEKVFIFAITGEMGMGGHETIGVNPDAITVFIFKKKVVIKLFGPIGFQEPVVVVALPGDVKGGVVFKDGVTRETGHGIRSRQRRCQSEKMQ